MPPAKTLRDAYNAANPSEPLNPGDPRYVNCTDVRGNADIVGRMVDTIEDGEVEAAAQVFISYAREDSKKAEKLYQELFRKGFSPWMDQKTIVGGEQWERVIHRAIRCADFVLVCLSETSVDKRGFFQKEIKQALSLWQEKLDDDIYLIPIRFDACEVPASLSRFQCLDLFESDGVDRLINALQVGIKRRRVNKGGGGSEQGGAHGEYVSSPKGRARFSGDESEQMFKVISFSDRHTHQLFTGHRGCGKSTELLRLRRRLEGYGFYVVYFAVDEDLDLNDLIHTELLLSIARRIIVQTSVDGIDLGDALKSFEAWFAEVVYEESEWRWVKQELETEAEIGLGPPKELPFIARLLTKLTGQIKTGAEIKKEIRRRLDNKVPQLLVFLNDLLNRADVEVQRTGGRGVVIIVDDLDRVAYKDLGVGRTSHDALFIEHGDQLCALRCHTIYTVPLSMIYGLSARGFNRMYDCCYVQPMIKTHEPQAKGGGTSAPGMERLRDIIRRRIDVDALCEPEAVEYLCQACGGHPRDLMTLIRYSIECASTGARKPITLGTARLAEARLITGFSRMIPETHFDKLAVIHLTNKIKQGEDYHSMLFCQSVLEYMNGPEGEPWHDVHPAVQKLNGFREALMSIKDLAPPFTN